MEQRHCEIAGCHNPVQFTYSTTQIRDSATIQETSAFCGIAHIPSFLFLQKHLLQQPEFKRLSYTLGRFAIEVTRV